MKRFTKEFIKTNWWHLFKYLIKFSQQVWQIVLVLFGIFLPAPNQQVFELNSIFVFKIINHFNDILPNWLIKEYNWHLKRIHLWQDNQVVNISIFSILKRHFYHSFNLNNIFVRRFLLEFVIQFGQIYLGNLLF